MKPYLEPGFVATLILKSRRREAAWEAVRRFTPPFWLTSLHVLQVENMLFKAQLAEPTRETGRYGKRGWDHYISEGVFQTGNPDWESGLRLANGLNQGATRHEFSPMMLLHGGLAASWGATHYLSFHTQYRKVAKALGLRVVPTKV